MATAMFNGVSPWLSIAKIASTTVQSPGRPSILVVDDEEPIRRLLQVALQRQGFVVWLAADGHEALDLYQQQRATIHSVLLDVRMPRLDGPETLAALQQIDPCVRCCFMSGYTGAYTEEELLLHGAERVFAKPFRLAELSSFLWQLLSQMDTCGA